MRIFPKIPFGFGVSKCIVAVPGMFAWGKLVIAWF